MKKILVSIILLAGISLSASVNAQSSYWVTTDAGEKMEVFPKTQVSSTKALPGSITTLFDANNNGSAGGAVYFDIITGNHPIHIYAFDINTAEAGAFTLSAYIRQGSYVGNESNISAWGTPKTGTGTGAGLNIPSHVTLSSVIQLSANTTYGIALAFNTLHSWHYTNGTGSNQMYSNDDLTLSLGAASNVPFSPGVFTPRVWNGTIYYTLTEVTVPVSGWAIIAALLLISATLIFRFRKRMKLA
jgi:hypothetical protein